MIAKAQNSSNRRGHWSSKAELDNVCVEAKSYYLWLQIIRPQSRLNSSTRFHLLNTNIYRTFHEQQLDHSRYPPILNPAEPVGEIVDSSKSLHDAGIYPLISNGWLQVYTMTWIWEIHSSYFHYHVWPLYKKKINPFYYISQEGSPWYICQWNSLQYILLGITMILQWSKSHYMEAKEHTSGKCIIYLLYFLVLFLLATSKKSTILNK